MIVRLQHILFRQHKKVVLKVLHVLIALKIKMNQILIVAESAFSKIKNVVTEECAMEKIPIAFQIIVILFLEGVAV